MSVEVLNPEGLSKPDMYRQVAVATGSRLVFIAGQVARDADGSPVGAGDLAAQTEQAFRNVAIAVEAAGVHDILTKVHGSTNPVNVTRATLNALMGLRSVEELSRQRGVKLRLSVPGQPAAAIGGGGEAADGR